MPFARLALAPPLLRALAEEGYPAPTPIQERAIPLVLAGRDVLALAQTGTGKTAAFVLPVLQRLAPPSAGSRPVRVLVLTPTRELAAQVGESFGAYGRHLPFRHAVVFGGVGQRPQTDALARGVDVLVATPGRLLDLLSQRHLRLDAVEVFVLDEADRMLDMGFLRDVQRVIAALPRKRQTLFFSATMPREAQALADRILVDPARVAVAPPATTVEAVEQSVYLVDKTQKTALLVHLLKDPAVGRALVFVRTKHGANRLATALGRQGVDADAIHGNKSQGQRERALGSFRAGGTRVLVATDIAARGIDVEGITHVVNFDLPNVPEAYVHRIGRTARAGATGIAISLCDPSEDEFLHDIERAIRMPIPVVEGHPFPRGRGPAPARQPTRSAGPRGGAGGGRGRAARGKGPGGGGKHRAHAATQPARPPSAPRHHPRPPSRGAHHPFGDGISSAG
jgi:ATP-dependent RNA helicase RhlE